ncbi:MAG: BatA domain-containing protein, partial [Alphaproteobacteria bacterium]|nr:BatA domain-containing protein [Alphaproteobacteria bacterium]
MMGALSFGAPLILVALLVLPAIWFLLRVTPPAPRREIFPPLRLLLGLASAEETPARTPVWLLLLRLFTAALIIIALAGPRLGSLPKTFGKGPLVLFVDNDWAAAHAWRARRAAMTDAIARADARHAPVVIVPTSSSAAQSPSFMTAASAERVARALAPQPFLGNRQTAVRALSRLHFAQRPQILWLSDDLDHGHALSVAHALERIGSVDLVRDRPGNGPLAFGDVTNVGSGLHVSVRRTKTGGAQSGLIEALDKNGDSLAAAPFHFASSARVAVTALNLPLELRNRIARLTIAGRASAGAVHLIATSSRFQKVGIVGATSSENGSPLLSGAYYLRRALSPYADLSHGTIEQELSRHVGVLVLSDIGRITGDAYADVARFVQQGGVLIRFAGPRMTNGTDALVPVPLRSGGRYLGGAMGWAKPQHL